MAGPLTQLRVLDLSRVLAGPWASQNLADLGADVIKIERPGSGDDTRQWGPPYLSVDGEPDLQMSGYFLSANRGKQSVAIDFTTEQGRELVRALAVQSDVVIENFKVGGLKKYGLDYDSLRAINERLLYCSITGFGQTGPYADQAGYDFMIQGMGGLMSITGESEALGESTPMKVGVAVADVMTGMYATVAILAALTHRDKTGQGQHIDIALLDCQVAMLANQNMNYLLTGQSPQRLGNAHPNIVPYQTFVTADGYIILAVGNDAQFKRFCKLADCAELADNPLYTTNAARVKHREQLIPLLQTIFMRRRSEVWLHDLQASKIPCGPINNLQAVFDNPQLRHRQMQRDIDCHDLGRIPQVGNPIHYSETPLAYRVAPPRLGQHTQTVLKERLKLSDEKIEQLQAEAIIQ